MLTSVAAARRALPSVDRLLQSEAVGILIARYGRALVTEAIRDRLDSHRGELSDAPPGAIAPFDEHAFVDACACLLQVRTQPSLKPVFNLTGTVLHTNLGRAPMPKSAAEAVVQAMTHPVNLEFDLGGGARGERDSHVERWLTKLTGAEAAVVVNNNAAAVYLTLNTLALKKEVLVSRGELIEIGGAFRMPDIMARAGCKLHEAGTTNRTHLKDYTAAISARTAAIMKVHTSNYAIQGFTAAVPERELATLAHEHGLPFIVDLGSGMLVNLEDYGLPHEPTPREAMAHGADLVTFSGDKLLGGPQAGLIVGKKELIARIRKNPMKRALRVDKMTLGALEAVLRLYADPERLVQELPTLRLLTRPLADIEAQAQRVLPAMSAALGTRAEAGIIACSSQIGSGSLPVDSLPSAGIAVSAGAKRRGSFADRIAAAFRALPVPVIGRIKDGAFIMDLRCLEHEDEFVAQLAHLKIDEKPNHKGH
ncbi:MAG: L-seryl-tRNA(Sec) selenium transferase [Betaproteobacteria bacterium RIFCSPLOWO2_12_FULL_62_58]|nr:MAG: L-seryl-tRNA(Sec) selenium transferase [Betaproteobacteria bacterium RIFCSPLOWO2_12_FULL_62_58]